MGVASLNPPYELSFILCLIQSRAYHKLLKLHAGWGQEGTPLDLSWGKVVLAACALIGTTILTIVVTRLVNWLLDRRSQLVVEVRVNNAFKAQKLGFNLKDAVREVVTKWEDREKLPMWGYDLYTRYFATEQYVTMSVTNATQKKMAGLTLSIDSPGTYLVQIGSEGPLIEVEGKKPVPLGDLQPRRNLTVDILAGSLFPTFTTQSIQECLVLSSDEHMRTRYKFPVPGHIAFRDKMRRLTVFNIVAWMVILLTMVSSYILTGK